MTLAQQSLYVRGKNGEKHLWNQRSILNFLNYSCAERDCWEANCGGGEWSEDEDVERIRCCSPWRRMYQYHGLFYGFIMITK
jgi:hypothetical protein